MSQQLIPGYCRGYILNEEVSAPWGLQLLKYTEGFSDNIGWIPDVLPVAAQSAYQSVYDKKCNQ